MQKKIVAGLSAVTLLGLFFHSWSCHTRVREQVLAETVSVRPKDFPSDLVAPENALEISYSSPLSVSASKGTHILSFSVPEPFPPNTLRAFVEGRLESRGWSKLRYELLYPQFLHEDKWLPLTDPEGTQIGRYLKDDWLNIRSEHITVILSYGEPPLRDPNSVHAQILFCESYASPREFIDRYQQLHPQRSKDESK